MSVDWPSSLLYCELIKAGISLFYFSNLNMMSSAWELYNYYFLLLILGLIENEGEIHYKETNGMDFWMLLLLEWFTESLTSQVLILCLF